MVFANPRLAAFARRTMASTLPHEYSLVVKRLDEDEPENPYGQPNYADQDAPPEAYRCLYAEKEMMIENERGRVAVNVPTMEIDYDDPLAVGDFVQEIVDRAGNVLAAGPLRVTEIAPLAAMGGLWRRSAVLIRAEPGGAA